MPPEVGREHPCVTPDHLFKINGLSGRLRTGPLSSFDGQKADLGVPALCAQAEPAPHRRQPVSTEYQPDAMLTPQSMLKHGVLSTGRADLEKTMFHDPCATRQPLSLSNPWSLSLFFLAFVTHWWRIISPLCRYVNRFVHLVPSTQNSTWHKQMF